MESAGTHRPWRHLPAADSANVHLTQPTDQECFSIWRLSSLAWRDALTLPQYLKESEYLMTVPLAKDGGMTNWILTDKTQLPNQRPILCSCESFRKRAFLSTADGDVIESIVHGVASVFTDPVLRHKGYASRLMAELATALRTWQTDGNKCIGSVLYSDIGRTFYAKFGWHPFPNNFHLTFFPATKTESMQKYSAKGGMWDMRNSRETRSATLLAEDLAELCREDEIMIRQRMMVAGNKARMVLVPDLDHMLWHHAKEEFACQRLFGKHPHHKGAIVGESGSRVWVIWTHRYYEDPGSADNILYILRLVVEGLNGTIDQQFPPPHDQEKTMVLAANLRAVMQAAQAEAAEWKLSSVHLWNPSSEVRELLEEAKMVFETVHRVDEGISSLLWYGDGSSTEELPEWIANEHYAWC